MNKDTQYLTKKGFTPTPILVLLHCVFFIPRLLCVPSPNNETSLLFNNATKTPYKNRCRGFTLMETLIAISILLIAVVAPMSTIGGSLSSLYTARDQMIAINLAQDGNEVVRQIRDTNMLVCWNSNPSNPCGTWGFGLSPGNYVVAAPTLIFIPSGGSRPIYQKDDTGLYYQVSSLSGPGLGYTKTQFTRIVNIENISSYEKAVTSTVNWTIGGVIKKIEVKESIFGINS